MSRHIKLTIEYDGTHFKGWQIQPKNQRTVQGEIINSLESILNHSIKIIGSGRTDTGVHALGQVAHFQTKNPLPADSIKKALNATLPKDISILQAEEANQNFHAQYSAKWKTYRYTILNREERSSLIRDTSLHYRTKLNVTLMRLEANALKGKKDFKSFQSSDPSKKRENTIRTIKRLDIKKSKDLITIEVEANGFLYKMARNIVGTLLEVGCGKRPKGSIKQILAQKDRNAAGATAKACGLCLLKVTY